MYKAIGFDYGGVLNNSKSALPGIAKLINMPQEKLRNIYHSQNTLSNVDSMSYENLWIKILTELGHKDKTQQAVDHMHQQWDYTINKQVLGLIDSIKSNGYKTGLLSNNTKEVGTILRERGLEKRFDVFLISAEIGLQKPSHEAFNVLTNSLGVMPSEMIFIDDSENSLRLSGEIGYHPILFTGYEKLKSDLTDLNVLQP